MIHFIGEIINGHTLLEDGRTSEYKQFRCMCGNTFKPRIYDVIKGRSKSCGCRITQVLKTRNKVIANIPEYFEDVTKMAEYKSWQSMKTRCNNPKSPSYKNYGGRGISYAPEWESFIHFISDMGRHPDSVNKWSIERINNDGNYEPRNCKWIPLNNQNRNTRKNIVMTYGKTTAIKKAWQIYLGVSPSMMDDIINESKQNPEDAITVLHTKLQNHPQRFRLPAQLSLLLYLAREFPLSLMQY